jgi:flagellar protein FlaF
MNRAANAYARTATMAQSGRETESFVLLNAAARLQAIMDQWDEKSQDLGAALIYNRRIWTILVTGVTAPENQLPDNVKQSIVNLAMFIFKRTLDTEAAPAPQKLRSLISINREIAAGLRAVPQPVQSEKAA